MDDISTRLAVRAAFYDRHPEGLEGYVRDLRQRHLSWRDIALAVEEQCGISIHGRTVHRMFANREWAQGRTRWQESPTVAERKVKRQAERAVPALKAAE